MFAIVGAVTKAGIGKQAVVKFDILMKAMKAKNYLKGYVSKAQPVINDFFDQ
jgi:hypothetical protein